MKLHKSAKLAVTAGLALSMTMGAAVPAIAAETAQGAVSQEDSTSGPYLGLKNENGAISLEVGGMIFRVTDSAGNPVEEDSLKAVQKWVDQSSAKGTMAVLKDANGNATFVAVVKVDGYIGLQLGGSQNIVALSKKNADEVDLSYVDSAKDAVASFLGVDKGEVSLSFANDGSLNVGITKEVTLHFFEDDTDKDSSDAECTVGASLDDWPVTPAMREGYTFKGYKVAGMGDRVYATPADMFAALGNGKVNTVVSDMDGWKFVGVWEKKAEPVELISVNFHTVPDDDSTWDVVSIPKGTTLGEAAKMVESEVEVPEGKQLVGWRFFENDTVLSNDYELMGTVDLYPVFKDVSTTVKITFAMVDPATGNVLADESCDYTKGESVTPWATLLDKFSKVLPEGYEITGWRGNDGVEYNSDLEGVVAGEGATTFQAILSKKAPEPVQWATATFYDEDGTTVLGTADYQVNEALGFWATTPAPREGYTFKGFAIKGQATAGVVDPATVTMPASGMSFIAVWEKTAPEVQWAKATFLDADGKTVIGTADYQIGKTLDVWAVTPAPRAGYKFMGYYMGGDPSTIVNPKDVKMEAEGMTFVAVWQKCGPERAQYAPAVFKDNGRTVAVRWYKVGKTLGSWKGAYPDARPGYTFKGYKIAGKDKVVSPRDVTMSKNGMVFEAVWSKNSTPSKPTPPSKPQSPFDDVAYAAWYAKPIAQAKELGYVNGYPGTNLFKPNANITRADAVCILFNMAGGKDMADDLFSKDGGKTFDTGFADVASNAYYAKALAWAKANGVANGYPDTGAFKPDQTITREEFAALLSNYAKLKGEYKAPTTDLSAFKDADTVSDWAKTVVEWSVENKVMGNGGFLAGQSTITRAEVAAMAVNFQPKAVESPVTGK